jgi:hypothetical protein
VLQRSVEFGGGGGGVGLAESVVLGSRATMGCFLRDYHDLKRPPQVLERGRYYVKPVPWNGRMLREETGDDARSAVVDSSIFFRRGCGRSASTSEQRGPIV